MKRLIILGAVAILLGAILIGTLFLILGGPPALNGTLLNPPMSAPDFELTSVDGTVRKSDFEGKVVVIFFGYTFCPDVCPTTLSRLRETMVLLGHQASEVQVLMVSVDPERDTPERVAAYAHDFNPDFKGLTGEPEKIATVAADFGIFHSKAEGSAETGYLVDHTAAVLVLNREGDTRLIWAFETTPQQMARDLNYLIAKG